MCAQFFNTNDFLIPMTNDTLVASDFVISKAIKAYLYILIILLTSNVLCEMNLICDRKKTLLDNRADKVKTNTFIDNKVLFRRIEY